MARFTWICVTVFCALFAVAGWLYYQWPPKNSSEVASWLQALGSLVGLFVAIGIAAWNRHDERKARAEDELRAAEVRASRMKDTRLAVERFIGLAHASIEAIGEAIQSGGSKHDVLIRGAVLSDALEMSHGLDLSALNPTDASTVLAARSVCSQMELLLQEERKSLAIPPLSDLRRYIPHYLERAIEIEAAWLGHRVVAQAAGQVG